MSVFYRKNEGGCIDYLKCCIADRSDNIRLEKTYEFGY